MKDYAKRSWAFKTKKLNQLKGCVWQLILLVFISIAIMEVRF